MDYFWGIIAGWFMLRFLGGWWVSVGGCSSLVGCLLMSFVGVLFLVDAFCFVWVIRCCFCLLDVCFSLGGLFFWLLISINPEVGQPVIVSVFVNPEACSQRSMIAPVLRALPAVTKVDG